MANKSAPCTYRGLISHVSVKTTTKKNIFTQYTNKLRYHIQTNNFTSSYFWEFTNLRASTPSENTQLNASIIIAMNGKHLLTLFYTTKKGRVHKKYITESGSTKVHTGTTLQRKLLKIGKRLNKKNLKALSFYAATPKGCLTVQDLHLIKYVLLKSLPVWVPPVNLNHSQSAIAKAKAQAKQP